MSPQTLAPPAASDAPGAAPSAVRPQRVLVVGATGGTGRAAVARLAADGHAVTAFSRRASRLTDEAEGLGIEGLATIDGDATDPEAVGAAVAGQDAVVVTLGIAENPLRVRVLGPARTPIDIRSRGTETVIEAMRTHGVRRLVVQSTFGVGATRGRLGFSDSLFFGLLLKPQIDDTERQEAAVRASGLDWTLVQPVHLDDGPEAVPFLSLDGTTREMKVSRASVARFLAEAVALPDTVGASVTVSG